MRLGRLVQGSVLDCNKKHFEKALKDYDRQLYIKWNSEKNNGLGLWEIRRKPNTKTAVPKWEYGDSIIFELQYVENDLVNHVLDVPALNYAALSRIREMDCWNTKNWVDQFENAESTMRDKAYAENRANLRYAVKQNKRAFSDFRELLRSGKPIAEILQGKW